MSCSATAVSPVRCGKYFRRKRNRVISFLPLCFVIVVCVPQLERWEASLRDYQVLIQELPENEDVKKALSEVEAKLKDQRNGAAAARSQH